MKNIVIKTVSVISIFVLMIFTCTSCNVKSTAVENKAVLSNNDTDHKLNNEVLVNEQKEINKNNNEKINLEPKDNKPTDKPSDKPINKFRGIPILMYHSIDYEANNELRVPKEKFEEQIKFLKENGYTTLTMKEAYDIMNNEKLSPEKPIVITLDDGYRDNYTNAYPILRKYDMKGTIFIITDLIDKNNSYLNSSQINEMYKNGIDFESHTVRHEQLDMIPYDKQLKTLQNSKTYLENMLSKKVVSVAYPVGKYNKDTIRAVKDSGYSMAVTTKGGFAKKEDGMLTLTRVRINASDTLKSFQTKIKHKI